MAWPSNNKRRGRTAPIADKNNNAGTERRQPRSDDEVWRSQLEEVDQLASSTIPSPGKHIQGKIKDFQLPSAAFCITAKASVRSEHIKQRYQSPSERDLNNDTTIMSNQPTNNDDNPWADPARDNLRPPQGQQNFNSNSTSNNPFYQQSNSPNPWQLGQNQGQDSHYAPPPGPPPSHSQYGQAQSQSQPWSQQYTAEQYNPYAPQQQVVPKVHEQLAQAHVDEENKAMSHYGKGLFSIANSPCSAGTAVGTAPRPGAVDSVCLGGHNHSAFAFM